MKRVSTFLLVVVLIPAVAIADAGHKNPHQFSGSNATPVDVAEYITSDGRIDLSALSRSGYRGPLELAGTEFRIDTRPGELVRAPHTALESDPDDIHWDTSIAPSLLGVNGSVIAVAVFDGRLIVGGNFTIAGDEPFGSIAAWDGASWSDLGTGVSGSVSALTVYDDKLIAGGNFTTAGDVEVNNIAAWNGTSWSALGTGVDASVAALTVYDGELIVAGDFATAGGSVANRIAAWDGNNWSRLGPATGISSNVRALTVYDDKLIAGGGFTIAGGIPANSVAAWDGTSWSSLGSGLSYANGTNGWVSALATYDNKLIVAGQFGVAGDTDAQNIAAWDGDSWTALGSGVGGFQGTILEELTVYDNMLIAGGSFSTAGGTTANSIASWDGTSWAALATGMNSKVIALTVFEDDLIAGGLFTDAGGKAVNAIAAWSGTSWSPLGTGLSGATYALAIYDNKLIAGGRITSGEDAAIKRIGAWDGTSWSALGTGMNGLVLALAVYNNTLIAGGDFTTASGTTANHIAAWDGTSWSALGAGLESTVRALQVYDDKLIAAGDFSVGGGTSANKIAAWDGTSWSALGEGMNDTVYALSLYDNRLIAGGLFTAADTEDARLVAAWDGTSWSLLGTGLDYNHSDNEGAPTYAVSVLRVYDGRLLAGGLFDIVGGPHSSIAAWDGSSWSDLVSIGAPIRQTPRVYALRDYDNKLIAGGYFSEADGVAASFIAASDGTSWTSLGTGVNSAVTALIAYQNELVVGGGFTLAGDKLAAYLATWTKRDVQEVVLDIKPGSCSNPINGNSARGRGKAVLPVAIIGTNDVNVHDIDVSSLTLNGVVPVRWSYGDVGGPPEDLEHDCACSTTGPDGHDDLELKFYSADVVATLNPGDSVSGDGRAISMASKSSGISDATSTSSAHPTHDSYVVTVEGQLLDGSPIEGHDCVTLAGNGAAKAAANGGMPRGFELASNHPNPFNPRTQISFYLPRSARVRLEIFDTLGRRVTTLLDEELDEGEHAVAWNAAEAASGVYYYRLATGERIATRKMLLLK